MSIHLYNNRFFFLLAFLYIFIIFDIVAQQAYISVSQEMIGMVRDARATKYVKNNTISIQNYNNFVQKMLNYFENNGFPFASVALDRVCEKNDTVFADLLIEKNVRCLFDSICVRGNLKVSKNFLKSYLNFKPKKLYNESHVKQISQLLQELPFATETQSFVLEFTEDKAALFLFLNKKRVNQFEGYIGLAPVSNLSGKIAVSGELNLHLVNIFTISESIELQWRATERFSQFLELNAKFPYLLGTPLGIDGMFMLDKKDTTYLNMNYIIGLGYSFKGYNYARVYFDYTTSNILNKKLYDNTDFLLYSDYRKTMYGFAFGFRKLDFIYNPRKGYNIHLDIAVGNRKVIDNNSSTDFDNNMELSATRYRMAGKIIGYIPLHKRWVLALGAEGGSLIGKQHLVNELFRFGGMNSLQGFDDLSIRASSYGIALVEMRFLMAKIAYINAFFNGAWYEQKITQNYLNDFPFGFGLGITFTTKAGLFYLSYALGKQFENPISFKTGKIHFGLAVQF